MKIGGEAGYMGCECPEVDTLWVFKSLTREACGISITVEDKIGAMTIVNINAPWGRVETDKGVFLNDCKEYYDSDNYEYIKVCVVDLDVYSTKFSVCYKTKEEQPPEGFFESIGDWFYNFDAIPLLSYPLRWLSTPFYEAEDWVTTIDSRVEEILSWSVIEAKISSTYDIVNHKWSEVTALIPTWSDIIPTGFPSSLLALKALIVANSPGLPTGFPTSLTALKALIVATAPGLPTWMPSSLTTLKALIKTTLIGSFSSIDTWFDAKKDTALGWVKDLFPYDITDAQSLLKWIGIEAGDVITTILDTPKDMWDWIKAEVPKTYDIVGHKWSEVTVLIPTWSDIIPEGFPTTFDELIALIKLNAPTLPSWLPTSLQDFKDKIITIVSDTFETILDKVFKEEE